MDDRDPQDLPASWADENAEAAGGGRRRWPWLVGAAVAVVVVALALVALLSGGGEEKRAWPDAVGGRPAGLGQRDQTAADVTPTADPGVYVWNDFDGWHLWVVNGDGVPSVSGTITSTDDISKAQLSQPGAGSVSVDGKTATFSLPDQPGLVGIDFEPGFFAKQLTITLQGPDGPVDASLVTTGSATPVTKLPLVIDKPVVDG